MKKLVLMVLFTASAIALTGCKKDKKDQENDNQPVTVARLQGKWEATKLTEKRYEVQSNKLVSENTISYPANERSLEYKGSEIFYYRNGTLRNSYTYNLSGSEMRMKEEPDFYFQVKFYSDTQHSHTEENYYKNNGIEMKTLKETYYNKK